MQCQATARRDLWTQGIIGGSASFEVRTRYYGCTTICRGHVLKRDQQTHSAPIFTGEIGVFRVSMPADGRARCAGFAREIAEVKEQLSRRTIQKVRYTIPDRLLGKQPGKTRLHGKEVANDERLMQPLFEVDARITLRMASARITDTHPDSHNGRVTLAKAHYQCVGELAGESQLSVTNN